jgi:hypothetical protein
MNVDLASCARGFHRHGDRELDRPLVGSVVGMTSMVGGFGVLHWNAATSSWISDTGVAGGTVSAGPAGTASVARSVASGLPVIRK